MKNVFASALLAAAVVQATVLPRDDSGAPNYASITAQPQPSVTGPTAGPAQQSNVAANSAASSTGSAAASATGAAKRDWCWPWWCPDPSPKTSYKSTSTPSKPTTTPISKPTTTPPATTTPWSKPATCTTTPYTPYYPALSTTGTARVSPTVTQSSGTACPTQPEAGTYCGFINPNDPCAPQPDGYGPVPTPDTAAAFLADPEWKKDALSAVTPAGFELSFSDLNASVSGPNYLGLVTLQSYSVAQCASACECTDTCTSFNIFVERDPEVNPANGDTNAPTVWGNVCPNPPSMSSYKCTLWGGPINATDATNTGGYREQFQVVIAGSNGYNLLPATGQPDPQPGWGNGHHCGGGGIWDPKHQMGGHFFPGPFDPRVCAAFADAQTKANHDSCKPGGHYDACNLWNAYALKRDGLFWGMYCALFTDHPSDPNAENGNYTGGFSAGFQWDVEWSWSQCHDSSSWNTGIRSN